MGDGAHADFATLAAPGAEHQRLRPFVGTFRATVKLWMGSGEPMVGEMVDPSGATIRKRSVITLEDDDHHRIETFFVKSGEELKGMEIRYTRVK